MEGRSWQLSSGTRRGGSDSGVHASDVWTRWELTWRLGGAGLQCARLLGHRFGEGVAASDQLPALVTFHVPHPHAHAARLGALRRRGEAPSQGAAQETGGVARARRDRPHLGPGGGVPFEARPLKAGGLHFGSSQGSSTRLLVKYLKLPSADAHTQDDPPLHAAAAGRVALRIKCSVNDASFHKTRLNVDT